jgi:hypothetical protein
MLGQCTLLATVHGGVTSWRIWGMQACKEMMVVFLETYNGWGR